MPISTGTRLGPYEVLSPLGAGGMGEVYRGRDPRIGRDVAIKVLPEAFSKDVERLHRFEKEARSAGVLNHPNVLVVYDVGEQDGCPYIVEELLEGETLRERLVRGGLSADEVVGYGVQIASGLAAAHEKGVVHRDLKPENLFLTRDGRLKILDFGLAKLTQPETKDGAAAEAATLSAGTEAGVTLGTVGYMSPEQVRGMSADARSDIFSLGTVLYEMATGQRAFRRSSPAETMSRILTDQPPSVTDTRPDARSGAGILLGWNDRSAHLPARTDRDAADHLPDVGNAVQGHAEASPSDRAGAERRGGHRRVGHALRGPRPGDRAADRRAEGR